MLFNPQGQLLLLVMSDSDRAILQWPVWVVVSMSHLSPNLTQLDVAETDGVHRKCDKVRWFTIRLMLIACPFLSTCSEGNFISFFNIKFSFSTSGPWVALYFHASTPFLYTRWDLQANVFEISVIITQPQAESYVIKPWQRIVLWGAQSSNQKQLN